MKNIHLDKKISSKIDNFNNKVVVITGSARGIGKQIALEFASCGASLFLADIDSENLEKTKNEIIARGVKCITMETNITNWDQVRTMIDTCISSYGRIDILINNAGTIRPSDFFTFSEEDWDFLQEVDLKGVVASTQAVALHMISQKYGRIINISSMASSGVYMPDFASYSAAKAAVNDFTKVSARELGTYGITVNAVAPGEILTELTYQDQNEEAVKLKLDRSKAMSMVGRIGRPKDVASLVRFLASDEASFITGQIIGIDGGRIDRM